MFVTLNDVKYDKDCRVVPMNLGDFVDYLSGLSPDLYIIFDDGRNPGKFNSYRGYYDNLALDCRKTRCKVSSILKKASGCINRALEGYKGGKYIMTKNTHLWYSEYGDVSCIKITHITVEHGMAIIHTLNDYTYDRC